MSGKLLGIRRSWIGWMQGLTLWALLGLAACSQETPLGDTTPPAVPTSLAAVSDTAMGEDNSDEGGPIKLTWQAGIEADLKGYNLYIGISPEKMTLVEFMDKATTSRAMEDLEDETEYFFALDAEDTSGNKSARSAPIRAMAKAPKLPKLSSSSPKSGAKGVSLELESVRFTFNKALQPDTVKLECVYIVGDKITQCSIGGGYFDIGTPSSNKKTYTFARKGKALLAATTYRLGIIGAKDKAGNTAPDTYINFQTTGASAPTLVSSIPANKAYDVSPKIPSISFTFSQPMQTNSVQLDCRYQIVTLPEVKCGENGTGYFADPTWSNNDRTLSFTRKNGALAPGHGAGYRLKLKGGKDKAGNSMGETVITFTTGLADWPRLSSSYPSDGDKNVPNQLGEVWFRFDKNMDTASFKVKCFSDTEPCNSDIANLLGTPVWTDQNRRVTFKPIRALQEVYTYGLKLVGKAQNGIALEHTPVVFTTTDVPRLVRYFPGEGTSGNASEARISLVFHKKMNTESLKAAISGSVSAWDGSTFRPLGIAEVKLNQVSGNAYEYTFIPDQPHGEAKVVVWVLGRNAKDEFGNPIGELHSGGFRTVRRFSVTIPADPKMTGFVQRTCNPFCSNSAEKNVIQAGYLGVSDGINATFVERGAISFNYSPTSFPANAQFVKATLKLKNWFVTGTPFAEDKLSSMSFERVDYGFVLDGSDFDTANLPCYMGQACTAKFYGPPGSVDGPVDVLNYFLADWADRTHRGHHSHFRLRFANSKPASGGIAQHHRVVYYKNPTLVVEYLAP